MSEPINSIYGYVVAGIAVAITIAALLPAFQGGEADSKLLLVGIGLVAPGIKLAK